MDLGIKGKTALVCASSKGLGKACAMALALDGVHVFINGRDSHTLEKAREEMIEKTKHTGAIITAIQADVTTADGRATLLKACPQPDILVNNAGGPPPGDFKDWDEAQWLDALNANMLSAIALIKAVIDPMSERGYGRIINITSAAVKAPIATLGLSNGARSGLTGFCAGLARQVAHTGVTINSLLPGIFETDRLTGVMSHMSKTMGISVAQATEQRRSAIPVKRFGSADELGALCAFLCSQHAGYIVGQNILIDGGAFPGTF